jgi:hypothetical protein
MLRITFGCLWAAFLALASGSFVYVDQELSWTDARDYCRTHHDDLASIHSSAENDAVAALCPSGTNGCWIGGSDSAQEGTWTWSDGTAWDYTNWKTNEPNDYKVHDILGEDCLLMHADGKWNDLDNNNDIGYLIPAGFVCATSDFPAGSDAASINSSNDKNSDDNSLTVILCVVIGALLVVIAILVIMKLRKPTKPPSEAAPPVAAVVHEPTAPPQRDLAPIKAMALETMSEETAGFAPEAASPPPGHISGAEAAMMAEGEPQPQPSEGWGRRFAAWRAGESAEVLAVDEEPPPPPAMTGYPPEAELEPEC